MDILDRRNSFVWFLLFVVSYGLSNFYIASKLDVYDKDAWYTKPVYWLLGAIIFIPALIMLVVFYIQIICKIGKCLDIPGSKFYCDPYIWCLMLIIPFIGWAFLITFVIYLLISILISLAIGKGEKYIK